MGDKNPMMLWEIKSAVLEKPRVVKGDRGQRIADSGKAVRLRGDKETNIQYMSTSSQHETPLSPRD